MSDFHRTAGGATVPTGNVDVGLQRYMSAVYSYMSVAMLLTGVVAAFVASSAGMYRFLFGSWIQWVVMLAPLGIVFYLTARINNMTIGAAKLWLWAFAALIGVSSSYIFVLYTGASVARVFFITAISFLSLSVYGHVTKRDLSALGRFMIMGLIGILIASLVNIFLGSPGLEFVISALGVFIFAGLTAYDTQKIRNTYLQLSGSGASENVVRKTAIVGALMLYLDFLNMFMFLLQFLGVRTGQE
jgi:FtsH-binding integral membrane protein